MSFWPLVNERGIEQSGRLAPLLEFSLKLLPFSFGELFFEELLLFVIPFDETPFKD